MIIRERERYVRSKRNRHIVAAVGREARRTIVKQFSREAVADIVVAQLKVTHRAVARRRAAAYRRSPKPDSGG
jgi:hypothetical protein